MIGLAVAVMIRSLVGQGNGDDPGGDGPPSDVPSVVVDEEGFSDFGNWVAAGIAVAIGVVIALLLRAAIRRLRRRSKTVTSTVQIVSQIVFAVVVAVSIYIALTIIGVDLTPLLAGAGIAGLTIGFALKDIAENYVSGILMGFNNPFSPGDEIIVDEGRLEGTVEELTLRQTIIRSSDGVRVLMPNSMVIRNPLENLTANGSRRSYFNLGVGFDTDLDEARRIAVEAVRNVPGVHDQPEPEAFVEEIGGSWVTIRVRFWHEPRSIDRWQIRGRAITAALAAVNAAGIDMPYRQQVVRVEDLDETEPPPRAHNTDHRGVFDDRSGDGSERE